MGDEVETFAFQAEINQLMSLIIVSARGRPGSCCFLARKVACAAPCCAGVNMNRCVKLGLQPMALALKIGYFLIERIAEPVSNVVESQASRSPTPCHS